jgi:PAS domain S-box-containing protein
MKPSITLKKLNLDISDFEEILFDHSIADVTDDVGNLIYVNKNFCKVSKYSEDELIGHPLSILKSDEYPSKFFTVIWDHISQGKIWDGEIHNRAKDGSLYWLKRIIVPIMNSEKNITHYFSISVDITKEKEFQERLLKMESDLIKQNKTLLDEVENKSTKLVQSERLATIGTMSSRIAHDLKQPLTIMQTYADMLTPEIISKLDYSDKQKWSRIQNSILDMTRIIEDVLDFARTPEIKKKKSSLLGILNLAINNIKSSYGIQINLPENDVTFKCDARKIEGVLSNLINNSVQALDGNGEIDVIVNSNSNFATIMVKDSGPGILDKNLNKIFEPMFTTKTTGTGLGLVICKSIVEQHGGTISVSNKPTTFTVTIPF